MPAFDGVTSPSIAVQFLKSGTWTSATISDVVQIDFRRGRERADLRDEAGFASIVFNNTSGIYDPDNTSVSSPWVVGGASILRDGLQMRIMATWNSVTYPLFNGFLENNFTNQGFLPNVTMTFYDGIGYIADGFAPALAVAANSETAAVRAGRMLDIAGWTTANGFSRSLTGSVVMLATVQNRGCMQAITECVNAIAGRFYISKSGVATLVPLADKFSRPTQLLFSDSNASNTVTYSDLITNPGTKYVVNQAIIMRGDNNQVTSTYNPSVAAYGVVKKEIFAPVNTDTSATNLALYESRKLATPDTYIERIEFNGLVVAKNGLLYPDFLSTELADQVSVQRTTYDGRPLQWNLVVEGMKHTITQNNWIVSFNTSDINPYSITI
jgi:hypothetical protein